VIEYFVGMTSTCSKLEQLPSWRKL